MIKKAYFIDNADICSNAYVLNLGYTQNMRLLNELTSNKQHCSIVFNDPLYLDICKNFLSDKDIFINNIPLSEFPYTDYPCARYMNGEYKYPVMSLSWKEYVKNHGDSQMTISGNAEIQPMLNRLAQLILICKE